MSLHLSVSLWSIRSPSANFWNLKLLNWRPLSVLRLTGIPWVRNFLLRLPVIFSVVIDFKFPYIGCSNLLRQIDDLLMVEMESQGLLQCAATALKEAQSSLSRSGGGDGGGAETIWHGRQDLQNFSASLSQFWPSNFSAEPALHYYNSWVTLMGEFKYPLSQT